VSARVARALLLGLLGVVVLAAFMGFAFIAAAVSEIPPGQSQEYRDGYLRRVALDAWEREQAEAAK